MHACMEVRQSGQPGAARRGLSLQNKNSARSAPSLPCAVSVLKQSKQSRDARFNHERICSRCTHSALHRKRCKDDRAAHPPRSAGGNAPSSASRSCRCASEMRAAVFSTFERLQICHGGTGRQVCLQDPVLMRHERARFRCRRGTGEPSPTTDVIEIWDVEWRRALALAVAFSSSTNARTISAWR